MADQQLVCSESTCKEEISDPASAHNAPLQAHLLSTLNEECPANGLELTALCAAGQHEELEKMIAPIGKEAVMPPPPPPPPTPVHRKLVNKHEIETTKCEAQDAQGPPPPPPEPHQPPMQYNMKMAAELKTALEAAIAKIEAAKQLKIGQKKANETAEKLLEARDQAEMLEALDVLPEMQHLDQQVKSKNIDQIPLKAEASKTQTHEDDLLSLQVLSARSSTPYMQPMSCNVASCDLEHVTQHVSPVKEVQALDDKDPAKTTAVVSDDNCESPETKEEALNLYGTADVHYSRANLYAIRDAMWNMLNAQEQNKRASLPNIMNCEAVELEGRLRHLNILKQLRREQASDKIDESNHVPVKSHSNEMMPSFYRRKSDSYNSKVRTKFK